MKNENIPADIKSKSLKEARDEIDAILMKLVLIRYPRGHLVAFSEIHNLNSVE